MNSTITTLAPVTPAHQTKTLLAQDGFNCSLLTLLPHDEIPAVGAGPDGQLLVVLDGEATVRHGAVTTILGREEALLIPKGGALAIAAHSPAPTKVLRVSFPPRQVVTPQIVSFDC